MLRQRIELQAGAAEEHAGEGAVDEIAEVGLSRVRRCEQRAVVGEVALYMPGTRHFGRWLSSSSKVHVHPADPCVRRAIKLPARGDVVVSLKNHLRPGPGTTRRR